MQETEISVQFVPGMRFLVFDFGVDEVSSRQSSGPVPVTVTRTRSRHSRPGSRIVLLFTSTTQADKKGCVWGT
eukprot:1721732-Rhodomonas_salina.2